MGTTKSNYGKEIFSVATDENPKVLDEFVCEDQEDVEVAEAGDDIMVQVLCQTYSGKLFKVKYFQINLE